MLLCQISDFSNVSVSDLQIGGRVNPFLNKAPSRSPKKGPGEKAKAGLWDERCASENYIDPTAKFESNATRVFGVDTQWRSSSSIFVVEARVPSGPIDKNERCLAAHWRITAEVDGKNLFKKAFIDRSFDDFLLVDGKGAVLFQTGELGFQFARANLLLPGGNRSSDLVSELPKSPSTGQSAGNNADGLEFQIQVERKDDTTLLKKVPARQEVTVGGKSMYVFALPLNLPIIVAEQETLEGNPERNRAFIILGLVSKDKFRNETWQLSPSVLLILLLIAVLTLLVLPLLKLLSMGPQDQWSLRDLILVVGAGIAGTGLLTLALVDAGAFFLTKEQVDDELTEFAGSMAQHTHKELIATISQLREFDERRFSAEKSEPKKCHEKKVPTHLPSAKLNVLPMKVLRPDGTLPYRAFSSVFWVDCGGSLVEDWDVRTKNDYFPPIVTRAC